MPLSYSRDPWSPENIENRSGYLSDLILFLGDAWIFDRDERDLHEMIQLSLLSQSEEALGKLVSLAEEDIEAFRISFMKIMGVHRDIRNRLRKVIKINFES